MCVDGCVCVIHDGPPGDNSPDIYRTDIKNNDLSDEPSASVNNTLIREPRGFLRENFSILAPREREF